MNPKTLSVGVDVHQDTLRFYLLDRLSGQPVEAPFTVVNNRCGVEQAISMLQATLSKHGYELVEVAAEATGLLWYHLYLAFRQSPVLASVLSRIVVFNPKLVARFKESLDLRQDKDDDRDARAIAERLRFGRLPETYVPDPFWQGLRRLTRYRYHLAHLLAQEKTRFLSYLFLKLSAWQQVKPFSDPLGTTSACLLTEYTTRELARLSLPELTCLIARHGRNHFDDPAATARKVRQALEASFPVDPQLDEAVTLSLALIYDHIRYLEKLLRRLDREIARLIQQVPNPLLTVPGLGPVISAGILAEIADISRFPDHPALAAYAGLTWKRTQSGPFEGEETYLTRTGSPILRYYLAQGAFAMSRHNLEYQAYYRRKYNESRTHKHKRALALTTRKLARLVHTLLVENKPYTMPQAALIQHGETAAISMPA